MPGEKKTAGAMQQTSIHIKPINTASEAHNLRTKELPYVRKELTYTNESWQSDSIANRLQTIKANTKAKTGRCLQAKATPIREGVSFWMYQHECKI